MSDPQPAGVFGFARIPAPKEPAAAQSAGITLKAFGWTTVGLTALGLLALLGALFFAVIFGAAFSGGPFGSFGSTFAMLILLGIVIALIVMIGFAVAFLFWASVIMRDLAAGNPGALGSMMALGIVLIVFGCLSAVMSIGTLASSGGSFTFMGTNWLTTFAYIGFGITFIVFSQHGELKAALGAA